MTRDRQFSTWYWASPLTRESKLPRKKMRWCRCCSDSTAFTFICVNIQLLEHCGPGDGVRVCVCSLLVHRIITWFKRDVHVDRIYGAKTAAAKASSDLHVQWMTYAFKQAYTAHTWKSTHIYLWVCERCDCRHTSMGWSRNRDQRKRHVPSVLIGPAHAKCNWRANKSSTCGGFAANCTQRTRAWAPLSGDCQPG